MSALDKIQAGEAAIVKAIADVSAYLKSLATTVTGGLSEAEAETVAEQLTAQAAALEALVPAAAGTAVDAPPAAGGPPTS